MNEQASVVFLSFFFFFNTSRFIPLRIKEFKVGEMAPEKYLQKEHED